MPNCASKASRWLIWTAPPAPRRSISWSDRCSWCGVGCVEPRYCTSTGSTTSFPPGRSRACGAGGWPRPGSQAVSGWPARRVLRVVWTAHNVLPHEQVFADDVVARKTLARSASVVLVHSDATAQAVRDFGAVRVAVAPQGSYVDRYNHLPSRAEARARLGLPADVLVIAHVGALRPYKGTHRLLAQVGGRPGGTCYLIAGACPDGAYRARLQELARAAGPRVRLLLGWLSDDDLGDCLAAADAAVFPFTAVSNSGSVLLALGAGLPVVVPDMPELASLPGGATIRFANTDEGLAEALDHVERLGRERLEELAGCAGRFAGQQTWPVVASTARAAYESAVDQPWEYVHPGTTLETVP